MKLKHMTKITVAVISVVAAGILFSCGGTGTTVVTEQTKEENKTEQSETLADKIYVYVAGAVNKPDVYMVEKECRVYQVIDMAGGLAENADVGSINLADKVYDGMKLTVYETGEYNSEFSEQNIQGTQKVNINTASKEELMTLPGIGESKADSIIRHREKNGQFQSIEDIMNISGIKEGAFDKIKDLITI